jgi:uncharacterized protein YhbP (UPF0306 family)
MEDEMELQGRAAELLRECTTMSLATSGPEGLWSADVFFAPRGLSELVFLSSPSTQHAANIIGSAAVTATIHVDVGSDWRKIRGLQLAGAAGLIAEAELAAARAAYFMKFPFAERLLDPNSEVESKTSDTRFFALRVQRLYLVDNRLGFGVRHAIPLDPAP